MAYTLRHLAYAVTVAEQGSITDAAEQLGISQPAVSAALRGLEKDFGLTLFVRRPSYRIALTPAGQRFIARARLLLEEASEFESAALGLSRELQGTVEVGCFVPTAPFMLPLILEGLAARHPGVRLNLHEGDLGDLSRWLASGQIEVALTYDMHLDPSIRFEPLIEAPVHIILSAKHPLAQRKAISLRDLADQPIIALDLPITQQFFQSLFLSLGVQPRIEYRVTTYEMVRSLVGADAGVALLIMRPVSDQTYYGSQLAYRPISDDLPRPHYGLAFTSQSVPTRLTQAFADECRRVLKDERKAEGYFVRLESR